MTAEAWIWLQIKHNVHAINATNRLPEKRRNNDGCATAFTLHSMQRTPGLGAATMTYMPAFLHDHPLFVNLSLFLTRVCHNLFSLRSVLPCGHTSLINRKRSCVLCMDVMTVRSSIFKRHTITSILVHTPAYYVVCLYIERYGRNACNQKNLHCNCFHAKSG